MFKLMNKIRKILLGCLFILTLGIFFSLGTKTCAANLNLDLDFKVTERRTGGS